MMDPVIAPMPLAVEWQTAAALSAQAGGASRGFSAAVPGSMIPAAALWGQLESIAAALWALAPAPGEDFAVAHRTEGWPPGCVVLSLESPDGGAGIPDGFGFVCDAAGALQTANFRDGSSPAGIDVISITRRPDGWDVASSLDGRGVVTVDASGLCRGGSLAQGDLQSLSPAERKRRLWRTDNPPADPDLANYEADIERLKAESAAVDADLEVHQQQMSMLSRNVAGMLARQAGELADLARRKMERSRKPKAEPAPRPAPEPHRPAPESAPPPALEWHYLDHGNPAGPIPEAELRRKLAESSLPPSTLVWRAGLESWRSAQEVGLVEPPKPAVEAPAADDDWIAMQTTPEGQERTCPIRDGDLAGRGVECRLVIPSATASRNHARFNTGGGRLWVTDLASSNGTRVNGRFAAGTTELHDGDRIHFGDYEVRIRRKQDFSQTIAVGPSAPPVPAGFKPTATMGAWTRCPACTFDNPPDSAFCGGCGYRLGGAR